MPLKSDEEFRQLLTNLYWLMEHGDIPEGISMLRDIETKALLHAAEVCRKEADKIYVGGNAIREGMKRGFRQAAIAILESAESIAAKLKEGK